MSQRYNKRYYRRPYGFQTKQGEASFRCIHCGLEVTCDPIVAGVQNRNHCPCCLWSRHLDWRVAGDRRSPCRAAMRPVGLTLKHSVNRYTGERGGELMIIHQCSRCEVLVINRVAADDGDTDLFGLLQSASELSATFLDSLAMAGIELLTTYDYDRVRRRLLGKMI